MLSVCHSKNIFVFSVRGGRWVCGRHQGLKFYEDRARHVHWHSTLGQDFSTCQVPQSPCRAGFWEQWNTDTAWCHLCSPHVFLCRAQQSWLQQMQMLMLIWWFLWYSQLLSWRGGHKNLQDICTIAYLVIIRCASSNRSIINECLWVFVLDCVEEFTVSACQLLLMCSSNLK